MLYDCLIIGAGQAGLACARIAQSSGLSYVILEQGRQAGEAWRKRAPELELFTPRELSCLSGLVLEGPGHALPKSAEMADYFEDYRKQFDIHCLFDAQVVAAERNREGTWTVNCADGRRFQALTLVLANGSNQKTVIPEKLADGLAPEVVQTDAERYWRDMPDKASRCLVVGDGASGRQIARDFAHAGFDVTLAGSDRNMVPNQVLQRNIFHWLQRLGLLKADRNTLPAKLLKKRNPVPRREALGNPALRKAGVKFAGRVSGTSHEGVIFEDGRQAAFTYVVWCTGYVEATDFLPLDGLPNDAWMTAERGVLPLPGVFVTGRRWLHNRASELIMGAEHDAGHTMSLLRRWLEQQPAVG